MRSRSKIKMTEDHLIASLWWITPYLFFSLYSAVTTNIIYNIWNEKSLTLLPRHWFSCCKYFIRVKAVQYLLNTVLCTTLALGHPVYLAVLVRKLLVTFIWIIIDFTSQQEGRDVRAKRLREKTTTRIMKLNRLRLIPSSLRLSSKLIWCYCTMWSHFTVQITPISGPNLNHELNQCYCNIWSHFSVKIISVMALFSCLNWLNATTN